MAKPFHVIATPDENGYTVTIPENPNVSARCVDALFRGLVLDRNYIAVTVGLNARIRQAPFQNRVIADTGTVLCVA